MEQTIAQSKIIHESLTYDTKEAYEMIDITDDVQSILDASGVQNGIINVYTKHTTTAIKINEREDGFFKDFKKFCKELVPSSGTYCHNDLENRDPATMCDGEECLNGHSHVTQMLVGCSSESMPVIGGKLDLGRWQRLLFIELDHARKRDLRVTIIGQ